MERYLKKRPAEGRPEDPRAKAPRRDDPRVLVTWNANGLTPRIANAADIQAFIEAHSPDVLCIQEARLKRCPSGCAQQPDQAEIGTQSKPAVSVLLNGAFSDFEPFWSLDATKNAGTLTLIRKGIGHSPVRYSWLDALCAHGGARNELIERGIAADVRHEPEGRMQYVAFESFDLLNVYVPNRGWTPQSTARRKAWDESMLAFLRERAARTALAPRPLVWAGDLNVAHTAADSTDEAFFRNERVPGQAKLAEQPKADSGIAGFSDNERARFSQSLEEGSLVDVWRELHPPSNVLDREGPWFSWRGGMAKAAHKGKARYEGKGQRIDYFCAPRLFLEQRVASCEILGRGTQRIGFLGSDHAPVKLTLRPRVAGAASTGCLTETLSG
jgi:exonuclease III